MGMNRNAAMNRNARGRRVSASPQQLRYARVLDAGMKFGLGVLILGFLAYVTGIVPARVPFEELAQLWGLAAPDYLRATDASGGWAWLTMLGRGEVLPVFGIAILCGVSLACLTTLLPAYAARGDWIYFAIVALNIGVLALAASGVLTAGH